MRRSLYLFSLVTLLLSMLWASPTNAQERRATITGHATDTNHDPLVGAKVELEPSGQTAVTDAQGTFKIADLAPGSYTLNISYVGFAPFSKQVTVASGGTATVDAELQIETVSEQVIVKGERERGEIEALNREETSDNILQVLPAEVITSLPNVNIADAVGRMPSVSLERDEGEGKYVQIRGTEPRLSNVTIDGVHVPSPEAVRNVKLDAIPADLVDSIEINKTLSANQEGDAIGGSVNLVTKKATDQPFITVLGMGGYTPVAGGRKLDEFTGTIGKRFGKEKRFGIMFGGSYDWNARGYDDVEPAPGTTQIGSNSAVPVFFGEDIREYWYDRTRFGFATSADYKLGTGSFLYLRGFFSQFKDIGQDWIYSPTPGVFTSPTTADNTGSMVFNHVYRNPFQQVFNVTAGAQHTFGPNLIGYEVSGAQARYSGGFPRGVFNGPTGIAFGLDTSDPHTPKFPVLNGVNITDPTTYTLTQVQYNSAPISEQDFTGNIWLTHQYNIGSHYGTFETGFKVRDAQKNEVSRQLYYNCNSCATMSQFLLPFTNPNYYLGAYPPYGPTTDWNKINSFFLANQGLFTPDVNKSHRSADANNFSLSERVYAGYVMNTINLGHFRLQTGLRFEGTQGSFLGTQANFDPNGNFFSDSRVPGQQSYLDVLPSVQLQYNINGSTNIRTAYGRGIARPNFGDLPPSATLDQGGVGGTTRVFAGNPALVPTHANDFDLLFEHYLKTVGIIQAGWFYKDLTDPIYVVQFVATTGPFAGFQTRQPINGPGGHIQGVEMSWQQHLRSLPGLLGSIGVSANYSYTTSQASFPASFGRTDHPALLRQAPNNWNFDVTYDKGPVSARMGLTHNDGNIFLYNFSDSSPGGIKGPNGDVYLYPHTQVDAEVLYHLPHAHDFQVVASFLNLNNEVYGLYQGSEQYPIQREYYNRTYSFGLRWTPSLGRK
ncbi:MAG: TonB-dependent receptor [Candidatus Acidiferrales bacterium]